MNPELTNTTNSYWLPTVVFDASYNFKRDDFFNYCKENKVDSRPFFYPLSSLPMFERNEQNNVAYSIYERGINLPSFHDMTNAEVEFVANLLNSFFPTNG